MAALRPLLLIIPSRQYLQRHSIRCRRAALLSRCVQVAALLERLSIAAGARSQLKDMRRYLAHEAGSKAASSYLGDLTAALLSQQAVADMQHRTASLRCGTCVDAAGVSGSLTSFLFGWPSHGVLLLQCGRSCWDPNGCMHVVLTMPCDDLLDT